jgi:hypothetical protein
MRPRAAWTFFTILLSACGRNFSPLVPGTCANHPELRRPPDISVTIRNVATRIRRDVDLTALSRLPGTEAPGPGGRLQGLTVVHHGMSYNTAIAVTEPWFGGQKCAWVAKLTIDLTPGEFSIIVPSDYADDSCEAEQILAHEKLHEEAHRDVLAQAAERMRQAFAKDAGLPTRETSLAVIDRTDAENRVELLVDAVAKPVFKDFSAELKRRQQVLDIPENYRWVSARCAHWR